MRAVDKVPGGIVEVRFYGEQGLVRVLGVLEGCGIARRSAGMGGLLTVTGSTWQLL